MQFLPYTIVSRQQSYDLRFLDAYTVVRMPYARRDEGYIGLGAYFDGQNDLGAKLAETQPVVMRFAPGVRRIPTLIMMPSQLPVMPTSRSANQHTWSS